MEILRYTLWRLERSEDSRLDDPAMVALKRLIIGAIAELDLTKDPCAAAGALPDPPLPSLSEGHQQDEEPLWPKTSAIPLKGPDGCM